MTENHPLPFSVRKNPRLLSLVIPVFNEEESVPFLKAELEKFQKKVELPIEIIFVDDGSKDKSYSLLSSWAAHDSSVKLIRLARNFGHQIAITVGMDVAEGDATVVMDADLQDPPEVILEMLAKYRQGFEIVYGQRTERESETVFKKFTAWAFYRVMKYFVYKELPEDVGDFRLVSRPCLDAIKQMREHHRFMRGMVAWVDFSQTCVKYKRPARVAGTTKYPLHKMVAFAWSAAMSFSAFPLRLSFWMGTLMTSVGVLYAAYSLVCWMRGTPLVAGWMSMIVLLCLIGGSIQIVLGIVGEYIAKIFEEVKGRPLYIVSHSMNVSNVNFNNNSKAA